MEGKTHRYQIKRKVAWRRKRTVTQHPEVAEQDGTHIGPRSTLSPQVLRRETHAEVDSAFRVETQWAHSSTCQI